MARLSSQRGVSGFTNKMPGPMREVSFSRIHCSSICRSFRRREEGGGCPQGLNICRDLVAPRSDHDEWGNDCDRVSQSVGILGAKNEILLWRSPRRLTNVTTSFWWLSTLIS